MREEMKRYDIEVQLREAALERFLKRYPGTRVVHASLLTDGRALNKVLAAEAKEVGVPVSAQDRQAAAEKAITLLASLSAGKPKGYDISPASGAILDALRTGRLSPEGQLAAIQAATQLSGARAQQELAAVVRAQGRAVKVRTAAASGLLRNIGRQGRLLTAAEISALQGVSREAKLDDQLKGLVDKLTGVLQSDDRGTGERLRDYQYVPRK